LVQAFLGVIGFYFAIRFLSSPKTWEKGLGIILMAAGIAFTLNAGEFIAYLLGGIPAVGTVKKVLFDLFPVIVIGSFIAWIGYMAYALYTRLDVLGILWDSFSKRTKTEDDLLEAAKDNALRDQFFWFVAVLTVSAIALVISTQLWFYQGVFSSRMEIMIIALVWAYVIPPLVIHTWLKKPHEITAIRHLRGFGTIKSNRINDYRELLAVMDEIKDENLKKKLDNIIVEGLSSALINHRFVSEKEPTD
jgi:hypothetical protein